MSHYYSDPKRENIETALPDVEVFYYDGALWAEDYESDDFFGGRYETN